MFGLLLGKAKAFGVILFLIVKATPTVLKTTNLKPK